MRFIWTTLGLLGLLLVTTGSDDGCDAEDLDGDGWTNEDGDCDDRAPSTHPGAEEICDNVDNDCDGYVEDGCACEATGTWYGELSGYVQALEQASDGTVTGITSDHACAWATSGKNDPEANLDMALEYTLVYDRPDDDLTCEENWTMTINWVDENCQSLSGHAVNSLNDYEETLQLVGSDHNSECDEAAP